VPVCIHGEHGRDVSDLDGSRVRYHWVRRLYRPFVAHHVALSRDLADYLRHRVGVPRERVTEICNGVDTVRFRPAPGGRAPIPGCPFSAPQHWVVGTVGRMQAVKNQPALARAFVRTLQQRPALKESLRLVMVGDGPLRLECQQILQDAGLADLAWLPGERGDADVVLRGLDCFVLPSLAEGISNTILEAMASGLPVLATDVGGNADLVDHGTTGEIVETAGDAALAAKHISLVEQPERAAAMGRAGRARVEQRFGLPTMVAAYQALYERQLERHARRCRSPRQTVQTRGRHAGVAERARH
jgi:sugar transferase (PEP-CTERM/EpsH1 system associated)